MGTIFHPVLLTLAAVPLALLGLMLISLSFLGIWGHFMSEKADRERKEELAAKRTHNEAMKAIEAEEKKIHFVDGKFVGRCPNCNQQINTSTGKCPNCGA